MKPSVLARNSIAAVIAGAGLAVGGIAVASAETATETPSASSSAATPDRPGGPRGDRLATTLASELGIDEAKVRTALDAVREDLAPDRPADGTAPTPPTDAERAEHRTELAAALAKELGVSEEKVTAALEAAQEQADADRAERRTEDRAALVTRLAAAVEAGTLTEADQASVLKAYDAELIGGPGGRGGPGGHGGPGGPGASAGESGTAS